jgi:uncharacterized protein (TIGR01244 family)
MTDFPERRFVYTQIVLTALAAAWLASAPAAESGDLPNRKDPLAGVTTAGQPSVAQFQAAAKEGFKSVIDLRGPSEDRGLDEPTVVAGLGMNYASLPVEGAEGVTYANASALDKLLAKLEHPVLVHCSTANRAGALLALRAKLDGADSETALALGKAAGVKALQPTVERRLAAGHD